MPQKSKSHLQKNSSCDYLAGSVHPENVLKYPHDFHDDELISYLIQNFGMNLGCTEVHTSNAHHFVDGLLAHRAYFDMIGAKSVVKEIDNFIKKLSKYTGIKIPPKSTAHPHTQPQQIDSTTSEQSSSELN